MPPDSCRTQVTWDLTSLRRRLHTDSSAQPHSASGCIHSTVRLTKMPPTQLSTIESLQRCVFSKDLSRRTNPLLQPEDISTIHSLSSNSSNSSPTPTSKHSAMCRHLRVSPTLLTSPGKRHLQDLKIRTYYVLQTQSPPKQRPRAHLKRTIPVLSRQVHRIHLSFLPHSSPMSVPPKWDHIPLSPLQPQKRVPVPTLREPTLPSVPRPVLVVDHSLSPCLPSYPCYALGYLNHLGMATSTLQTVTSCIINTVSRCFSGTQAQHAGTPPRLLQRLAVGFMRLPNKKPVITCPKSRTSSSRTQVAQILPSCSSGTLRAQRWW